MKNKFRLQRCSAKNVAEVFVQKLNHDISAKKRASGSVHTNLRKRIFVSFDHQSDERLKDFIIGQSRLPDSPFDVVDCSMKETAPEANWAIHAERRIKSADIVLVMVGPETHKAPGVLKEVKMARDNGIHIVQVIGYKDGNYTAVPDAGRLYRWNWDNLKKLLA